MTLFRREAPGEFLRAGTIFPFTPTPPFYPHNRLGNIGVSPIGGREKQIALMGTYGPN